MAGHKRYASERIDRHENGETSGSDTANLTAGQHRAREKARQRLSDDLEGSSSRDDAEGIKVEFSGSENDGEAAYKAFTEKKKPKRMRTRVTTSGEGGQSSTGVGKKALKTHKAPRKRKDRVFGDETSDDDDDALENNVPEYIKARRTIYKGDPSRADRAELLAAGFRLPPTYEDIDFSDDERLELLEERPQIPYMDPPAGHCDINLEYSAGVIPAAIAQWLKPYQVEGAAFLHELFVKQQGGILGDDMGLGKTIQVIAALTAAFGKSGDERDAKRMRKMRRAVGTRWYPRILIICPGSLMSNWEAELNRWGWWSIYIFHGTATEKHAALQAARSGRLEIMITTYTTYVNSQSDINMIPWDCCIADECHIIKERRSQNTKAMNEVNALCRMGLTGTAIQNKYEELWTLLNWTNPGRFGPLSAWKDSVSDPLKLGQSHDATATQLAKARKTAKKLVQNLLPHFFLRRMKSLIAHQLPKKTDRVVFCPLTETQAKTYECFINSDMVSLIRTSTEPCDCGSGKKKGWCHNMYLPGTTDKWQNYVFPCMNVLRNLSNHVGLLIPSGTETDKINKELDYLQIAMPDQWRELHAQREHMVTLSNREFCGKWRVLSKLLKYWHGNGDKVLIFSYSIRLLKLLSFLFQRTNYNCSYLDGHLSYEARTQVVDDFNANPNQFVFLISTRAGGVGLNITSANKVVVVDPNWNPSYDLQAQDRAYRIGQTRDVEVFRLVSTGTIEEIVYARQIYKQQQANIGYTASLERRYFKGVQENKYKKGEIFGLQNLFSYQGDNVVLRDIVNKTNVAESRAGVAAIGLDMTSQEDDRDADHDNDFLRAKTEEKEDEAMSQLAALIQSGDTDADPSVLDKQKLTQKRKQVSHQTDAIQGILAGAGVDYTHENSEVVGSSKIEAKLSKRAEEAGDGVDEAVFASHSQSQSHSQRNGGYAVYGDEDVSENHGFSSDDDLDAGVKPPKPPKVRKDVAFRYRPPEEVRQRQFCSIARHFGFEDVVEFALVCEGWTQAQRRECLDRFYGGLREGRVAGS